MIWYNLSKGNLKIPNTEKYTLVCTYLTLMELAFTSNNFGKPNEVQNAIKQILNSKPEFILLQPLDYARTLIDKEYKPELKIEENIVFTFLRVLLNNSKDSWRNTDFEKYLLNITTKRKANTTDWANLENKLNEPLKKVRKILKKYYLADLAQKDFQDFFVFQINNFSDISYSPEQINWLNFEFYEKVYKRYHRNLFVSNMKVDCNDKNDLENMIYVQPTNLYWTLEKRWLTIAKEIKLENYLFIE